MSGEMSWYVARAGGFLAWALSAFSILWGLLITSRALGKRITGPRLLDLHRFIGGLSVVFVFVHILGLRLHRFQDIHFGFKDIFIPMSSSWHPGAVAYGIVAFYLLIAVELTSLLRRKIPASIWRRVHYSGFFVFLLGSIHALKVGTDVQNPVIWWPSAIVCAAVVGLAVTRAMAAAQIASAKAAEQEMGGFGKPAVIADRYSDPWAVPTAAPAPTAAPLAPVAAAPAPPAPPIAESIPGAVAPADPVREALATTARVDDNRTALLERTRRSLERLDITAYPQAELPAEILTTRPVQEPTAAPQADQQPEALLPTRPVTDIALRYARLRNPTNPQAAPPPSFQADLPLGAQSQSNWGQPPAGWDGAAVEGDAPAETIDAVPAEPVTVEATATRQYTFAPLAEPVAPVAEPVVPPALFADVEPVTEPAATAPPVGLPDPNSRTAWEDQLAPQVSSLDWRTPAPEAAFVAAPVEADFEADVVDEPESTLANGRSGLPSRTPQRLARSTQPARNPLDWKPQRLDTAPMGGAPPPPSPDPVTGEVPSEQYRTWLREWLAFAESYDG
ncbi:MAG: ferric reductase-like transmembrane domain-containing protein [Acidimicrobiales bacterium]